MDLKGVPESKHFVDHRNYINAHIPTVTPDIDMFWRMMRQSDDNMISHITNPNVGPNLPIETQPPEKVPTNPQDFLGALLLHLLTRGNNG